MKGFTQNLLWEVLQRLTILWSNGSNQNLLWRVLPRICTPSKDANKKQTENLFILRVSFRTHPGGSMANPFIFKWFYLEPNPGGSPKNPFTVFVFHLEHTQVASSKTVLYFTQNLPLEFCRESFNNPEVLSRTHQGENLFAWGTKNSLFSQRTLSFKNVSLD